jgi:hypothetical protein
MHSPAAPLRLRHPKADGDKPKPGARARVEYLGFDPFPQPAIRPHRTDFATNSPIQPSRDGGRRAAGGPTWPASVRPVPATEPPCSLVGAGYKQMPGYGRHRRVPLRRTEVTVLPQGIGEMACVCGPVRVEC